MPTKTKPEAGKPKNGQFEDIKLTKKVQKENGQWTSIKWILCHETNPVPTKFNLKFRIWKLIKKQLNDEIHISTPLKETIWSSSFNFKPLNDALTPQD